MSLLLPAAWLLHATDVPYLSRARSGAVLGQGRGRQPVSPEELGELGEAGGVASHRVGGGGDPLYHHLADLLLDGALGVRDVPRRDLVVPMGAAGHLPSGDAREA